MVVFTFASCNCTNIAPWCSSTICSQQTQLRLGGGRCAILSTVLHAGEALFAICRRSSTAVEYYVQLWWLHSVPVKLCWRVGNTVSLQQSAFGQWRMRLQLRGAMFACGGCHSVRLERGGSWGGWNFAAAELCSPADDGTSRPRRPVCQKFMVLRSTEVP